MNVTHKLAAMGLGSSIVLAGGLIAPWEGLSLTAYKDIVGVWTQCYGNTYGVDKTKAKTDEQCTSELAEEVQKHNEIMKKPVKVPLTIYQEAAFTSLVYNIGGPAWNKSTALRLLNQGRYEEACHQLLRWNKAGGKVVRGLTNRRKSELEVCLGNNEQAVKEAERVVQLYKEGKI
ncbi:endolysin [Pseudomonas phage vB_PpuM-Amme-3]|uniref:Lysozyme n=1 Tax=Pseudomonas phage vB_PpuM-Amme-3 TaxID=3132617 RepID=A0AAX4MXX9_9CAUD